jgi:hypothetical protein
MDPTIITDIDKVLCDECTSMATQVVRATYASTGEEDRIMFFCPLHLREYKEFWDLT